MTGSLRLTEPHSLTLRCSPGPHLLEHSDHSDQLNSSGRGHGWVLQGKSILKYSNFNPLLVSSAHARL